MSKEPPDIRAMEFALEAIAPQSRAELVLYHLDRWKAFVERVKEIDALADRMVKEWIAANGPLDPGAGADFVWAVGADKDWKCTDVPRAFEKLMELSGGDFEALARDFLAKNPFKHGAARAALGEKLAAELFRQVVKDKLEKKLKKVPKRLMKPPRPRGADRKKRS